MRLGQECKKPMSSRTLDSVHLLQIISANNLWHNLLNTVFGHTVSTLDISPCVCTGPHACEGVVGTTYKASGKECDLGSSVESQLGL